MLADTAAREGDWLVALDQVAGKGRQGRAWVGAEGNFFGSTIVELSQSDPQAQLLSLAAAIALIEALDAAGLGEGLMLKWPNDLLLDGAKIAGILLERSADRVVIGFGVNLGTAPDVAGRPVAHLSGSISPQAFAPILAASFARALANWRSATPAAFVQSWLDRAHPLGTPVAAHDERGDRLAGTFDGLDPDGSLRLRLADGNLRTIRAGDVTLG